VGGRKGKIGRHFFPTSGTGRKKEERAMLFLWGFSLWVRKVRRRFLVLQEEEKSVLLPLVLVKGERLLIISPHRKK